MASNKIHVCAKIRIFNTLKLLSVKQEVSKYFHQNAKNFWQLSIQQEISAGLFTFMTGPSFTFFD